MTWDKPHILQKLRQLHRAGKDLSYNRMCRTLQPVVSAAAYHFGSYRRAVEKAGIDYAEVTRRPRWTRPRIIQLIKQAMRRGQDLHWSAVTRRRDELGRAAFASLQPRLFGSWVRALHGAGLDAADIARYRTWDRNSIIFDLKSLKRDREPVNSGAVQQEDPGLHAAAIRHFGTYDQALRAAGLDPAAERQRKRWTREHVLRAFRARQKQRRSVSSSAVRREDSALYGAAIRLFGSFTKARAAAGIKSGSRRR